MCSAHVEESTLRLILHRRQLMAEPEGEGANYVFDEINVSQASQPTLQPELSTYTEKASLEEIVAIAKQLWGRVKNSSVDAKDNDGNDKLFEELRNDKEFQKFATSFPVIMRWIVQARKYNLNALKHYLRKHATADLKTQEAFLDLQAEYLVLIFKEENPHISTKRIKTYRDGVIAMLRRENKEFMEINDQVEKEMEERNKNLDKIRREELRAVLMDLKMQRDAAAAAAVTVTAVTVTAVTVAATE
jgi:hypothetical protein